MLSLRFLFVCTVYLSFALIDYQTSVHESLVFNMRSNDYPFDSVFCLCCSMLLIKFVVLYCYQGAEALYQKKYSELMAGAQDRDAL